MRRFRKIICMLLAMLLVMGMTTSAVAAKKVSNVIVIDALEKAETETPADTEEIEEVEVAQDPEEMENPEDAEDLEGSEELAEIEEPVETEEPQVEEPIIEIRRVEVPFPEGGSVEIFSDIKQLGNEPAYGDIMYLTSVVTNLDDYEVSYQWEQASPNGIWMSVAGATGKDMSVELVAENVMDAWRLTVVCAVYEEIIIEAPVAEAVAEEVPAEEAIPEA